MKNRIEAIRIRRSRQHKQQSPNGLPIVYVGRPTKWGNPFILNDFDDNFGGQVKVIIQKYSDWINGNSSIDKLPPTMEEIRRELKGKNLSCWCKAGDLCHADLLLEIANE